MEKKYTIQEKDLKNAYDNDWIRRITHMQGFDT
jgi:hypothetical protein